MNFLLLTYLLYSVAAVTLTVWLARTLYRHGEVFLRGVFADRPEMAHAVNRLLVTGFYLLNLGYAFVILRSSRPTDLTGAFEVLAQKLGLLLVTLAFIHFINMLVFHRLGRGFAQRPIPPTGPVPAGPAPTGPAPTGPVPTGPAPAAGTAPAQHFPTPVQPVQSATTRTRPW